MERPSVVLQDGHPTHITWAVADVDKDNQVLPGTNHGTKIVVVPFDGVAFYKDFGVGGNGGTGGAGGASSVASGRTTASAGAGGTATTGGVSATGGSFALGGAPSNGAGGHLATGGLRAVGGASGAADANTGADAGGCGCRLASAPASWKSLALLGVVGLLRRRRARR